MEDRAKRKAEDELAEALAEFKRGRASAMSTDDAVTVAAAGESSHGNSARVLNLKQNVNSNSEIHEEREKLGQKRAEVARSGNGASDAQEGEQLRGGPPETEEDADGDGDRRVSSGEREREREKESVPETEAEADAEAEAERTQEEREVVSCDVKLQEVFDKNTLIWLESKHNARFFLEEYGVTLERAGNTSDVEPKTESQSQSDETVTRQATSSTDLEHKSESQPEPLCFRISAETSDKYDREEAEWFVKRAANYLKFTASSGVFVKCFWYDGPIPQGSDGMLAVSSVVKKIKGLDGRNLERIQDRTGVIIGVITNSKAASVAQSSNTDLLHKMIGVRVRCIRRKGLVEASKKIQQLLGLAGNYFHREAMIEANDKNAVQTDSKQSSTMPAPHASAKKNLMLRAGQSSSTTPLPSYNPFEKHEGRPIEGYMRMDVPDSYAPRSTTLYRKSTRIEDAHDDDVRQVEGRNAPNAPNMLYVYNLPGRVPARLVKSVVSKALSEKLSIPYEPVVHASVSADESYAVLHLANESLVAVCLQLYSDDRTAFDGLKVSLPQLAISKVDGPGIHDSLGIRKSDESRFAHDDRYLSDETYSHIPQNYERNRYIELEHKHKKSTQWWDHEKDEEPNTLYLTELGPNASALSIRELLEDILTHYIGPPLVSSSGRRLVLDVRYVPTKGCAFVDMATPELVDFMLDLHHHRPEMFDFMKMEIGNKYANEYREENYRSDWLTQEARTGRYGSKGKSTHDIESLSGYGYAERTSKRMKSSDYPADELRDHYYRSDVKKHPKSDPEKTVFAYGFPANASAKMICQIFERVLRQDPKAAVHDEIVVEVRIPSKSYCFVVFATQELTRLALQFYAQDRNVFDKIQLRPHVDSRMEERFWSCFKELDHEFRGAARSIEFNNRKQQNIEDHFSPLGSSSKFQNWKGSGLSSERYIPASMTH